MASVATIYEHAKILKEAGYNPVILHEKNDYMKPDSWLGEGYEDIPVRVPDINEARKYLNWKPKYNLEKSLYKTLEYYTS